MDVSDAKRLRQLEEENARLENGGRAGAGHFHPQECPLKKLPRPVSCREVVRYVQTTYAASQQRACATLGINRGNVRPPPHRIGMRACADACRNWQRNGVQRLHVLLRGECLVMNHKRMERLVS